MPKQPTKDTAALYLELPAGLRRRLDAFVERNRRKLKGEVANAIEQYLDREEAKERASVGPVPGLPPTEQALPAPPPAENLEGKGGETPPGRRRKGRPPRGE